MATTSIKDRIAAMAVEAAPVPTKFKALHLPQYFLRDGRKVVPDSEGYYAPTTAEEWDLLCYYAETVGCVVPE